MVFVHFQLSIAGQSHFKPLQRPGRGTVLHHAVRVEHRAVAGTMEALVALEITDRAAQVGADGVGHRETFLAVAEHEYFFLRQKRGRTEGEIPRVADLEGLRRLVKHARRQKPDHRSQAHADGGTQGDQARGAPAEEGSSLHVMLPSISKCCTEPRAMIDHEKRWSVPPTAEWQATKGDRLSHLI